MRGLFDEFSSRYDETMLKKLKYRAHLHVREMAQRVLPRTATPWRTLDLGCGTGLVGMVFKDLEAGGQHRHLSAHDGGGKRARHL